MSAPTTLDSARTGTPDGTLGIPIPTIVTQDGSYEAPGGFALSDRIPAAPTADRSLMTAADTATDMSTTAFAGAAGANLLAINNRGAIVVWCTFEAATDSATVRLVYYDSSNNPLFIGPPLTFAPLTERLSAAGHYMSVPQIVESYGASKYRPYLETKGDAVNDVSIFGQPI